MAGLIARCWWGLLLSLVLTPTALVLAQVREEQIPAALEPVIEAVMQEDFQQALHLIGQLELSADHDWNARIQIRYFKAAALHQLDQTEAARQLLLQARSELQADPSSTPLLLGRHIHMLGLIEQRSGNHTLALEHFRQAIELFQRDPGTPPRTLANSMSMQASSEWDQSNPAAGIALLEQAIPLFRTEASDSPQLCAALHALATARRSIGDFAAAARSLDEAASCITGTAGQRSMAWAAHLREAANLDLELGQRSAAEHKLRQALPIMRGILGEGHALVARHMDSVAHTCLLQGNYGEAERMYLDALQILQTDPAINAVALAAVHDGLATLYRNLGQPDQALAHAKSAVKRVSSLPGEQDQHASYLATQALIHMDGDELAVALPLLQQALDITEAHDPHGQKAITGLRMYELGVLHHHMGRAAQGLTRMQHQLHSQTYLNRALRIATATLGAEHEEVAIYQDRLGVLLLDMGKHEQAALHLKQAARIRAQFGSIDDQSLSNLYLETGWPDLAILYGKRVINQLQTRREQLGQHDSSARTQLRYMQHSQDSYTHLLRLLFHSGRLAEAQQVSAMLKEQELFESIGGNRQTFDPRRSRIGYTRIEEGLVQRLEQLSTQWQPLRREHDQLALRAVHGALDAQQQDRLRALQLQLTQTASDFEAYLHESEQQLPAQRSTAHVRDIQLFNAQTLRPLQQMLGRLDAQSAAGSGHTVLLNYLVFPDEIGILLTTADSQQQSVVELPRAQLRAAITGFRHALNQPADLQLPAQQLHDWLIAPIQPGLTDAGTLMLALSDELRYLPFAALHDGERWLTQRYALSMYTDAAAETLLQPPRQDWQIQAFGMSQPAGRFQGLPAVPYELASIAGDQGALPGRYWLDADFTADRLRDSLQARPAVLHIASHFQLQPGNESDSVLLLGDGSTLSLTQIRALAFDGTELLTLSACSTALGEGRDDDGREVEGFGALAQRRGAAAVLASLWNVSDGSTAILMRDFYRARQQGMSKAQALRQAQLAMIEGKALLATTDDLSQRDANWPGKTTPGDPQRPREHPHHWAAFILMGNWQ